MFTQVFLKKIDSTHRYALLQITKGETTPLFIYTSEQTDGVGRKGDPWIASGKENLLGTFLFPLQSSSSLQNLGQLLAYSTMQVLTTYGLKPLFKWPNDLLLSEKKVCGILADLSSEMACVSIGLNVNMQKKELHQIPIPATSLFEETQRLFSLANLRNALVEQFDQDLSLFFQEGFSPFFPTFKENLAFIGERVRIEETTGILEGLCHDGRLILNIEGHRELFSSGSLETL